MTTPLDELIAKTRPLNLYPFVFASADSRPGAIVQRFPHYLSTDNILAPHYAVNGLNPLSAILGIAGNAADVIEPVASQIVQVFVETTFSAGGSASISYDSVEVAGAFSIAGKSSASIQIRPKNLRRLSYPAMNDQTLEAAFTDTRVLNAPNNTPLGRLVEKMKRRHPTFPLQPRELDIAQFVVVARGLEMEFTAEGEMGAQMRAEMAGLLSGMQTLKISASFEFHNKSKVIAQYEDVGVAMPLLWCPWRFAFDGHRFVTSST